MVRGGATYWVGRGLRAGATRTRWASRLDGVAVQRAESVVSRYGAPVVAASFLTVGVQTAINAAAGAMRMPARRYVPGLLVGAVLWALLYTTAGAAVWEAVGGRLSWWWAVVAVAVIALVVVVSRRITARWHRA
ncbi:MAG: VTT domain-containing protein [Actinomycetales bacterium]|nr:VTT domain-containing protein [Candidatus Lutibacillus vidarii]